MCNAFIIGDLVIDHAIFVRESTRQHQQDAQGQTIYDVVRRTDKAGGAANCARILAALSTGETYLWGVTGKSHWGSFRSILEHSQEADGSKGKIEFRGTNDETEAQMNTVTRLITEDTTQESIGIRFGDRFDEAGHLHVPSEKRDSVLDYLNHVHKQLKNHEDRLDVIIINDLDRGCLTKDIVEEIAKFASENHIPLFVDPKYEADKYSGIKGAAILPNLAEWCQLVEGSRDKEGDWKKIIEKGSDLSGMAYRTLRHFDKFDYCIIKCDVNGMVLIGPSPNENDPCHSVIYQFPACVPPGVIPTHQLGCGDVMTAVFAMHFDRQIKQDPETKQQKENQEETDYRTIPPYRRMGIAIRGLGKANVAVGCYRKMAWHRMPERHTVEEEWSNAGRSLKKDPSIPSLAGLMTRRLLNGIKYLPKENQIVLRPHETIVPNWYSVDRAFRGRLDALVASCGSIPTISPFHMILGGSSGCGKSALIAPLKEKFGDRITELPGQRQDMRVSWERETRDELNNLFKMEDSSTHEPWSSIFIIDEARKRGFETSAGALGLVKAAERHKVRFLLLDSGFTPDSLSAVAWVDFRRRCEKHIIPSPVEHPYDIPFMVMGFISKSAADYASFEIRGDFLLAYTNALLETPRPGDWEKPVSESVDLARKNASGGGSILHLHGEHLQPDLKRRYVLDAEFAESFSFTVSRGESTVPRNADQQLQSVAHSA